MNTFILSIGSNIIPYEHIEQAIIALRQFSRIERISELVVTRPIGIEDQPAFVNGAVRGRTSLSRDQFNDQLKVLEDWIGRDRSRPKFGPREIDLDIIVWNNCIVDHDYYSRGFLKDVVDQVM